MRVSGGSWQGVEVVRASEWVVHGVVARVRRGYHAVGTALQRDVFGMISSSVSKK